VFQRRDLGGGTVILGSVVVITASLGNYDVSGKSAVSHFNIAVIDTAV